MVPEARTDHFRTIVTGMDSVHDTRVCDSQFR